MTITGWESNTTWAIGALLFTLAVLLLAAFAIEWRAQNPRSR